RQQPGRGRRYNGAREGIVMGFTVLHQGGMKDSDYRTYLLLVSRYLLKRGEYLDSVPRVRAEDNGPGWLYVWDEESQAAAFAEQILPILTGLSLEQLGSFGAFRVVAALEETELVPLTPLGKVNAG